MSSPDAVKDVFAGRIVGYSISDRGKARLAVGSIGQVGSAGDTAAMERFLALLQRSALDRRR